MYRIQREHHHRTGDTWCIYPMYDFAHGYSDAIEGVTHSICTLEFENHRPLYDWFLDQTPEFDPRPQQIEFARLNLTYMTLSKRKLKQLVEGGHVAGWDDPRMPTLAGLRRRGVHARGDPRASASASASRSATASSTSRSSSTRVREDLNARCRARDGRRCGRCASSSRTSRRARTTRSTRPGTRRTPSAARASCPSRASSSSTARTSRRRRPRAGSASSPGGEVRLRYACIIRCQHVVKDDEGRSRRAPLHLGRRLARRQREGRAQGEGHAALGIGEARRPGRGASLRPALLAESPGEEGDDFLKDLNPNSMRGPSGRGGAGARGTGGRRAGAVRARGVLLRRPGAQAGAGRLQPNDRASRLVGSEAGEVRTDSAASSTPCCTRADSRQCLQA